MSRLLTVSLVFAVVLASGCKHQEPATTATITVSDWKPLAMPVEIVTDGNSVGTFTDRSFSFPISPGTTQVTARVGFACGAKEFKVPLKDPTDDERADDQAADRPIAKRGAVSIFVNQLMAKFWIDNREGTEKQVKIGELEFTVPADSHPILEVPAPLCQQELYVKLNGEDIGPWPQEPPNSEPLADSLTGRPVSASNGVALRLLLDVRGSHCYNYRVVLYADRWMPNVRGTQSPGTNLSRQRLYALQSSLDYFFTAAPDTVQFTPGDKMAKGQLTDLDCR
jgi:hypothetical protein